MNAPLSTTAGDRIMVRGLDLAHDLIGRVTFTELMLLELHGEVPPREHVEMVDAVMVALMEHGITPSTLAARLVLEGAPDALQGAVAAGVLAIGSRFLGTVEEVGELLQRVVEAEEELGLASAADLHVARIVESGGRVPGLGHNLHAANDPRVEPLLSIAARTKVGGRHVDALHALRQSAEAKLGKTLIVNAVGAIGAVLADLGYAANEMRGFSIVARAAGLFAHLMDERKSPIARSVWQDAHERYSGTSD